MNLDELRNWGTNEKLTDLQSYGEKPRTDHLEAKVVNEMVIIKINLKYTGVGACGFG
jgi:hypothetical protein